MHCSLLEALISPKIHQLFVKVCSFQEALESSFLLFQWLTFNTWVFLVFLVFLSIDVCNYRLEQLLSWLIISESVL